MMNRSDVSACKQHKVRLAHVKRILNDTSSVVCRRKTSLASLTFRLSVCYPRCYPFSLHRAQERKFERQRLLVDTISTHSIKSDQDGLLFSTIFRVLKHS